MSDQSIPGLPRVTGEVVIRHPFPLDSCPTDEPHELSDCTIEVQCDRCKGAGVYPAKNGALEMYEVNLWNEAHAKGHCNATLRGEYCTGWHFIKCALCGGTGRQVEELSA